MINEITVPEDVQQNWQEIVDILARLCGVRAALVMKLTGPDIEVFVSSRESGSPYRREIKNASKIQASIVKP